MAVHLYDDLGVRRQVVNAWYSDGVKMHQVRCMWLSDTAGALRRSDDCVGAVQINLSAVDHVTCRATWTAPGASKVRIYGRGNPDPMMGEYNGATGTADYGGMAPNQYIEMYAVAIDSQGGTTQSADAKVTLPNMPAPTTVSSTGASNDSYTLSWASVKAASRYDVFNAANNGLLHQTTAVSWARTGLGAGTTYSSYVKAVHATGVSSSASPVSSIATQNRFPAGTYFFYPRAANTWSAGAKVWRGTGDGKMWHGDGGIFSASGGSRISYFFDYHEYYGGKTIQQFFAGFPTNVTAVQVRTMRSSTKHGIYSGQTCRYQRHGHGSQPGTPGLIGEAVQPGTLALGENKWFPLPIQWAREWIAGQVMGITWGNTPYYSSGAGYMYGPTLGAMANQCEVAITVS